MIEYSSCSTDTGLVKNNHGHMEESDCWHRGGVICTCDCKVLIGYCSNVAPESA